MVTNPDVPVKHPAGKTGRSGPPDPLPKRIALFDVGTNSIKLLIVESTSPPAYRTLFFARTTTRLGAGGERDQRIGREALDRTVEAVAHFQQAIRRHGCRQTFAFATHALRSAANAKRVVTTIERRTGIQLRVLSGGEEAFYAFLSAQKRLALKKPRTMLLDIGGGSTEFVYAAKHKILRAHSLPLGAIQLTESFLTSDPVAAEEFHAMMHHIDRTVRRLRILRKLPAGTAAAMDLVVSGGAVWTLVEMISHMDKGFRQSSAADTIKRHQLRLFLNRCLSLAVEERKKIKGLEPDRADIIVAGLAIVLYFMRITGKRKLIANEGGVREGVLQAIIQNNYQWPEEIDPRGTRPAGGLR
jgi:exopolyphosphatase/guanosine-5'-triphosphate,3'-diphosphate pyrophosphatase